MTPRLRKERNFSKIPNVFFERKRLQNDADRLLIAKDYELTRILYSVKAATSQFRVKFLATHIALNISDAAAEYATFGSSARAKQINYP
jgi:hypothetical protein